MNTTHSFTSISDHFTIGDLRTSALVSKNASIDWLCLPYFDSPSIFGKILDKDAGCFALHMPSYAINEVGYLENTAIAAFTVSDGTSEFLLKDFMVPKQTRNPTSQLLVREITSTKGSSLVTFIFQPRPEYGAEKLDLKTVGLTAVASVQGGSLILHLPKAAQIENKNGYYSISVPVGPGETKQLILEFVPKEVKTNFKNSNLEKQTRDFWYEWVSRGTYTTFRKVELIRSAITLKLLQFYPTGAIVAAPTTSLPEHIGGVRNWDYRYTWIRDSTFALYAFKILGYHEEAERYFEFIEDITEQCINNDFDVSLMYTIWGEPVPQERILKHLSGYKNSSPVRVGNGASEQFQLDVYGALLDAIYFATRRDLTDESKLKRRKLVMNLVRKIDDCWQTPDFGIWEARDGGKLYTYSRVMAWVGADRAQRLEKDLNLSKEDMGVCENLAQTIRDWIWQNCYDKERQILVQHPDTKAADSTNLLFVLLQFLDKHDELSRTIVDNTIKELGQERAFMYRYLNDDGLPGKEGAFLLCSYWLVSALAILEDTDSALMLFKELERYIKPGSLLPEEIDPSDGSYLGNYPQAFSHIGYIMSVYYIDRYTKRRSKSQQ